MMKINGWQRIGVVASVLWALGGGVYEGKRRLQYADDFYSNTMDRICPQRDSFSECMQQAGKTYEYMRAFNGHDVLEILFVSIVPVVAGWLLAYLSIMAFRWVKVGFVANSSLAGSTINVQMKVRDREVGEVAAAPKVSDAKAATVAAKTPPPFWLPLTMFMTAVVFAANKLMEESTGVYPLFSLVTSLPVLAEHPSAVTQYLAEALGMTLPLPLVHLAVSSFFKRMRNPTSRRKIFMGWSVFSILAALLASVF